MAMNCDPIASIYRWLEYAAFGRALQHRREAFLSGVRDARRALVLGDGDGRALEKLLACAPDARIDSVDLSAGMLNLARIRVRNFSSPKAIERVAFHHADALTIPLPEAEYDLIVTHFFLDCLDEAGLEALIERVKRAARPNARWIVSEFREPKPWAHLLIRGLYLFFRIATGLRTSRLVDHRPILKRNGFCEVRLEAACAGLLSSELWSGPLPETEAGSPSSTEPLGNATARVDSGTSPGTYGIGISLGKYTA